MAYERIGSKEVGRPQSRERYEPSAAPKWDVLQRERLRDGEGIELDYRTNPVLLRADRHYAIFIIGLIGLLSLLFSVISSLTGIYLNTEFFFALFCAMSFMAGVYKFITDRVGWIAAVYALLGPTLWLLAVIPQAMHRFPSLGCVLFILSLGLSGYLADCIASHYAEWLAASPQLVGERRRHAQAEWKNRGRGGAVLIGGYGVLIILLARTPIVGFKDFLWITLGFLVIILYWATGFKRIKEKMLLYREALVNWLTYARYQAVHFDFVEKEPVNSGCLVLFFQLGLYGLIAQVFYLSFHSFNQVGGAVSTSFVLLLFLLMVMFIYVILFISYHRNGTIFANPQTPPGLFKRQTWIKRNLLTAGTLFCLFTTSIHFMSYAPLIWVYGNPKPLLAAFSPVANQQLSVTGVISRLQRYEPVPVADLVNNLSRGEALLLRSLDAVSQREYVLSKQTADYLSTGPGAWVSLAIDSALMGKAEAVWAILFGFLQSLFFPILIFLMTCLAVFGRALPHFAERLEAWKSPVSDWEGYVYRLQHSPVPAAREHLWLGVHATEDYPVLLHRSILAEHAHLLGDSGSGKTALGMTPILAQLVSLADSAIVIIDLKGDMALFQAARAGAGERFKFFTNEVGKATYAFNPVAQMASDHLSLNQVCEVFLSALGLEHGEGYGRSYYARVARSVLSKTLTEYPELGSFQELRDRVSKIASTVQDVDDAFELIAVIESLAEFPQLNHVGEDEAAKQAIHMPTAIQRREVVYFWLPAAIESATVREIAKLALYTLFSSAYQHQRGHQDSAQVWVFIDEFQHIASLNFKLILQQARSMGLGMILANQSDSDLWTTDADLKSTVQTNTRFKQIFSMSNPKEREELSRASGETLYYTGRLDASGEATGGFERIGPRLMANDIIALSDEPDTSIVLISRGAGYAQFGGYAFAVRGSYHITLEEYERRKNAPWPEGSAATVTSYRKKRAGVPPPRELRTAYILSDDEPPPDVDVSASPWGKRLQTLHQAQTLP